MSAENVVVAKAANTIAWKNIEKYLCEDIFTKQLMIIDKWLGRMLLGYEDLFVLLMYGHWYVYL